MSLSESYKRWRHTRGYGVHSTFAYRLLTEAITCPYAYYGYSDVNRMFDPRQRHSRTAERARLVLRLAAWLRPDSYALTDSRAAVLKTAMRVGHKAAKPVAVANSSLVISPNGGQSLDALASAVVRGASVVAFEISEEASRSLVDKLTEGVAFIARDALILVPRPQTAKAVYTANF